jgi:hypothetical protein
VEVYVPPADLGEVARALLDAAGEDPVEVEKVQTLSGGFRVPRDIADRAGVSPTDDNAVNPAATGTQAAFAPSPEPVSGDAVIKVEADRGTASREAVGAVFDPPTEPVSGDAVITAEADSGNASPEAVGAVFAQNSPTGEGADANADDDAQPQPEPEPTEPEQQPTRSPSPRSSPRRTCGGKTSTTPSARPGCPPTAGSPTNGPASPRTAPRTAANHHRPPPLLLGRRQGRAVTPRRRAG